MPQLPSLQGVWDWLNALYTFAWTGNKGSHFEPLENVCEFLNALHIYADEARSGKTRTVEANHFCSHAGPDLRQCLIYDSAQKNARLIGIEYMIPKHVYDTLDPEEQKLWHTHEFEVLSGMLVMPRPRDQPQDPWETLEYEAMKEVVGLYGKTWHFWQIDRGDKLPLGHPKLMGSLTFADQADLEKELQGRNQRFDVDHKQKAKARESIKRPSPAPADHPQANSWWKQAQTHSG